MSNTKQPPAELVEKMKEFTIPLPNKIQDYRDKTISEITTERAEKCAQIAVQHSEKIQEVANKLSADQLRLIEENRELRQLLSNLVSTVDAGYMSHYEDGFEQWEKQLEEDILKAKQLLNK